MYVAQVILYWKKCIDIVITIALFILSKFLQDRVYVHAIQKSCNSNFLPSQLLARNFPTSVPFAIQTENWEPLNENMIHRMKIISFSCCEVQDRVFPLMCDVLHDDERGSPHLFHRRISKGYAMAFRIPCKTHPLSFLCT